MSKGSKRRPRVISRETYEQNWDRIFAKKKAPKPKKAKK